MLTSLQNLCLEKPKKSKSCRVWGHSRTLSRVEALGMVSLWGWGVSGSHRAADVRGQIQGQGSPRSRPLVHSRCFEGRNTLTLNTCRYLNRHYMKYSSIADLMNESVLGNGPYRGLRIHVLVFKYLIHVFPIQSQFGGLLNR